MSTLRLVPVRPSRRRRAVDGREPEREFATLAGHIAASQVLGETIQRTVARGRRAIVDVQCGPPLWTRVRRPPPAGASAASDATAALSRQVQQIHERLLNFAARVELEMDRLEVARADLERAFAGTPSVEPRR